MASSKQKHLPLLYNPLINSIFNNPIHEKSALKSTIHDLSLAHNDYAILAPPAHILQECQDDAGQKLVDLCYNNDDFVRSHIIKIKAAFSATTAPGSKVQLIIYNTMNGKQVLIKNRMAYTGKGFKKSMKLSIVEVSHFRAFCDYFPKGSRFLVLYIEDSLFGHKISAPVALVKEELPAVKTQPPTGVDVTFERILRTFPVLSQAMSEHLYILFHHNNRQFQRLRTRRRMPLETVVEDFKAVVSETNSIVSECVFANTTKGDKAYSIVSAILKEYPRLDLDTLIHEYVELNIYDTVWLQLVFQYLNYRPDDGIGGEEVPLLLLTPTLYKDLSCLSLNQLEIPAEEPWIMNVLHKRVSEAIDTFSKLSDSTSSNRSLKVKIITDTMKILTEGAKTEDKTTRDIVIDADTLIGLSIMVVVHSKVPNLEAHLYYIRHFEVSRHFLTGSTSNDSDSSGVLSYMLSNFEAVIYHLSNGELNLHLEEMSQLSTLNYQFWSAIQKKNISHVSQLLDEVYEEYGDRPLPKNHYLRSRNIHGESCFAFAIRSRDSDIFRMLVSRTEHWILFEDLIFDMNTSTEQNLLMLALQEEAQDMVMSIIATISDTASKEEQYLYYNSRDINGRTVGHYLSHDIEALESIGNLIDWRAKDNNSYTPLLSLCRCYDHHDYNTLIQKAFQCVANKQKSYITYDDHIDKSGNTLLHVIAKDIKASGLLDEKKSLIDVNRFNKKYLLPVGIFIRYSRLENLKCLFADKRLIFDLEDPQSFYNILDYYSFSASRAQSGNLQAIVEIRQAVVSKFFAHYFPVKLVIEFGAMNARYDGNTKDWAVNFAFKDSGDSSTPSIFRMANKLADKVATKYVPFNQLRQFVKILRVASPLSFAVNPEIFWVNFPAGSITIPFCSKFRTNRILEHLNLLFLAMNFHSRSSQTSFLQCFSLCGQKEPILVLDFMNDFARKQEVEKTGIGEIKLAPQKIDEIEYFLNYSKEDLLKYKRQISRLSKLVSVGGAKQCDFRAIYDRFLTTLPEVSLSELETNKEARQIDASYHMFESFAMWIEICVTELLKNCGLVAEKLHRWRLHYARIKEINAELHRFEQQIVVHLADDRDNRREDISRRSTMSLDAIPLEDEETKSTFFGLIDNKKSRYRKLLFSKSEEVKKVMDLNVEIKMEHETIAAEISQFLSFRSGFMAFAIKQFTNSALVLLRHRQYELTKALYKTRKKDKFLGNLLA